MRLCKKILFTIGRGAPRRLGSELVGNGDGALWCPRVRAFSHFGARASAVMLVIARLYVLVLVVA